MLSVYAYMIFLTWLIQLRSLSSVSFYHPSLFPGLYRYPDSAASQKLLALLPTLRPNQSSSSSRELEPIITTVFLLSRRRPWSYSITSFVGIECLENWRWGRDSMSKNRTHFWALRRLPQHWFMFSFLRPLFSCIKRLMFLPPLLALKFNPR